MKDWQKTDGQKADVGGWDDFNTEGECVICGIRRFHDIWFHSRWKHLEKGAQFFDYPCPICGGAIGPSFMAHGREAGHTVGQLKKAMALWEMGRDR